MKRFINTLVIAGLLLLCNSAKAATASSVFTGTNTLVAFTAAANIQSIVVVNAGASAATFTFTDSSVTNATFVLSAYTNYTSYTTNIVTVFTTFSGVNQTNTNTGIFTVVQTVAQSTNNYRNVLTLVVPANTTTTFTPVGGVQVSRGLTVQTQTANATNATVTTTYSPSL